ncbi:hypothetical protein GCM10027451_18570 [Geodermatophilus aquaeductus]|uniref:Anti-anti-sigma factor n=1 Tax=Geodermatophilus aquaeductus TaxID=1564161 RepID=A0A521E5S6_9ACTN|nr:anti-anti-sigma factor [Geodermatophilus aquaeductus]
MAADPAETTSAGPSVVRPGPGPVPGPDRPRRLPAARRRGAGESARPSRGRPRPVTGAAAGAVESVVHLDLVTGRLTLTGPLDARATSALHDAVSAILRAPHPSWTVDVSGLTGIDEAGLRGLLAAYHRTLRHGRRITLHGASPPLRRVLVRLRLDRHLLQEGSAPPDPG